MAFKISYTLNFYYCISFNHLYRAAGVFSLMGSSAFIILLWNLLSLYISRVKLLCVL
jgi:hypothetical protein